MAEFTEALKDANVEMICKQPIFFVSTAAADGRINLSPKGLDCFRVLGPRQVGYVDLAGSGNETHAHLAADGRITIMFCKFEQPALILRIYGKGTTSAAARRGWAALAPKFTLLPGTRQIFLIDVESVQTSCGWGVPFMAFDRERDTLIKYHRQAEPAAWVKKMSGWRRSIDGLPTRATNRFIAAKRGAEALSTPPNDIAPGARHVDHAGHKRCVETTTSAICWAADVIGTKGSR